MLSVNNSANKSFNGRPSVRLRLPLAGLNSDVRRQHVDMTVDEFFDSHSNAKGIYNALAKELMSLGQVSVLPSKSQVAFRRHRNVAIVWLPERYLKQKVAPLVLTFSFPAPDGSPRWKEVVQVAPGRYTHHLELYRPEDVDAEVRNWLHQAWEAAA